MLTFIYQDEEFDSEEPEEELDDLDEDDEDGA